MSDQARPGYFWVGALPAHFVSPMACRKIISAGQIAAAGQPKNPTKFG
jgi:hypothetical protein